MHVVLIGTAVFEEKRKEKATEEFIRKEDTEETTRTAAGAFRRV